MTNSSTLHGFLPPLITGQYASALGLVFAVLSIQTLRLRRKLRIRLGDGGNPSMLRAIRVHANFAEYVPLCLGLMFLTEVQSAPTWFVHGLGMTLIAARLIHATGVGQAEEKIIFRAIGVVLTLGTLLVSCTYLIAIHFI